MKHSIRFLLSQIRRGLAIKLGPSEAEKVLVLILGQNPHILEHNSSVRPLIEKYVAHLIEREYIRLSAFEDMVPDNPVKEGLDL